MDDLGARVCGDFKKRHRLRVVDLEVWENGVEVGVGWMGGWRSGDWAGWRMVGVRVVHGGLVMGRL